MKGKDPQIIFACWLVALVASVGSLFFSEVMEYPPCVLCWYQRIAMYPLVVIFWVSRNKKFQEEFSLAFPFVFF